MKRPHEEEVENARNNEDERSLKRPREEEVNSESESGGERSSSDGFSSDISSNYNSSSSDEESTESSKDKIRRHILRNIALSGSDTADRLTKLEKILKSSKFHSEFLNEPFADKSSGAETTIFIEAIKKGNDDIVSLLRKAGANPNAQTKDNCPLLAALSANPISLNIVKIIFLNNDILKNSINKPLVGQNRPLFYAVPRSAEVTRFLISLGANITLPGSDKKAVLKSSEQVNNEVVEPIIFNAVRRNYPVSIQNDSNLYCSYGEPLIYTAIYSKNKAVINSLLQNVCNLTPKAGLENSNNIYMHCLNHHDFQSAFKIARLKSNQINIFDTISSKKSNTLTPLESFGVDGSDNSRKFITEFGNIKEKGREEFLEKFIKFSREKYMLGFTYSNLESPMMTGNVNFNPAKIAKYLIENSDKTLDKADDIIEILSMITDKNRRIDLVNSYLTVQEVAFSDHAAFFIIEKDKQTNHPLTISYCDGNCINPSLDESTLSSTHGYGVLKFTIDDKKLINITTPDYIDNFNKILEEKFDNFSYDRLEDFFDSFKETMVCDENNNLLYDSTILTERQKRGNCGLKSANLVVKAILQMLYPELVFETENPVTKTLYPSGSGYDIYKSYKNLITVDPIRSFINIVQCVKKDDLIYPSALESLKHIFSKAAIKKNYTLALELLSIFENSESNVDLASSMNMEDGLGRSAMGSIYQMISDDNDPSTSDRVSPEAKIFFYKAKEYFQSYSQKEEREKKFLKEKEARNLKSKEAEIRFEDEVNRGILEPRKIFSSSINTDESEIKLDFFHDHPPEDAVNIKFNKREREEDEEDLPISKKLKYDSPSPQISKGVVDIENSKGFTRLK